MIGKAHAPYQTRRSSAGWNPGRNPSPKGSNRMLRIVAQPGFRLALRLAGMTI
jgi:hypothetical protein